MWTPITLICSGLAIGGAVVSALPYVDQKDKRSFVERDGVKYTRFEHAATGAKMDFVTNSGICETTPGVNTYSGYLSVGTNMNMWFWFFEARHNPQTAPLATWFNGGPGCSSMIGLFQENGPCHFVNGETKPSLNLYSWNEYANMLYIDQPIGTGFSYGNDDVSSTVTAAPFVWKLLQAFYTQFSQYENRNFGVFTESYGGHYGPEFASYFESQNAAIAAGTASGHKIPLVALGINNGWFDPILQYKAYIDYSFGNSYRALINSTERTTYTNRYNANCLPALKQCSSITGADSACMNADNVCYGGIEGPLTTVADFDVYDVRAPSADPNPPQTYVSYLQDPAVVKAIGAQSKYQECPNAPYNKFAATGDDGRSFLATLSDVVKSGVQTLIWAGDADWICNWYGNLAAANALSYANSAAFKTKALTAYNVNGVNGGSFKSVGNFGFLRVTGAGHEVPFYQPQLALQVFKQIMSGVGLAST